METTAHEAVCFFALSPSIYHHAGLRLADNRELFARRRSELLLSSPSRRRFPRAAITFPCTTQSPGYKDGPLERFPWAQEIPVPVNCPDPRDFRARPNTTNIMKTTCSYHGFVRARYSVETNRGPHTGWWSILCCPVVRIYGTYTYSNLSLSENIVRSNGTGVFRNAYRNDGVSIY